MKKGFKISVAALILTAALVSFAVKAAPDAVFAGTLPETAAQTVFTGAAGAPEDVKLNISARASCLMEADTGTVIFAKNEKAHYPIASMVKIMTLNLIFDDMEAGKLKADDRITVSRNASGMGGSQAFLDFDKQYKADDLIMSITIASANDACVAMAEHLEGSVEGFVNRMNDKARALGCTDTVFANCTGLPSENAQYSCARDVALMTRELTRHQAYYPYAATWMKDLVHDGGRVTGLTNTNKLVRFYPGCDGGKTGFTGEALHCLSATAKRGDMRLISSVIGAADSKTRFAEVSAQFNYGFANFGVKKIVEKDKTLDGEFPVALGREKTLKIKTAADFSVFGARNEAGKDVTTEVKLGELKAPIAAGGEVGKLCVFKAGSQIGEVPLLACSDIHKKTYGDFLGDLFGEWVNRG